MELAYAALHQLCLPMVDHLDRLPAPQREALNVAFGLSAGPTPDRLMIGMAVLSLFSDVADAQPLVCLIDDLQWLDRATAQVLAFLARRLVADPVALIMATRTPDHDMTKVPTVELAGLPEDDARALLAAAWTAPVDETGSRSDHRRDSGQSACAIGTSARSGQPGSGRRIRDAQRTEAVGAY